MNDESCVIFVKITFSRRFAYYFKRLPQLSKYKSLIYRKGLRFLTTFEVYEQ